MPTCCCVPGCSYRGGLSFPKDEILKKRWILALRRNSETNRYKNWTPQVYSVVCHQHFREDDFVKETSHGTEPLKKQRRPHAVPSIFPWINAKRIEKNDKRDNRRLVRQRKVASEKHQTDSHIIEENIVCDVENVQMDITVESSTVNESPIVTEEDSTLSPIYIDSSVQTMPTPLMSVEKFMFDNEGMLFYTGLASYTDFLYVLQSLGPAVNHLRYIYSQVHNVSIENQLFLTLMKLRQNKTNFEISRFFSISPTTVDNIWIMWVNFMSHQWREVNFWPNRELVTFFSPQDFKSKFPSTRVIIDGTEIPVKKPKPPVAQQSTYSTYKNRNTVKVLVGSAPGGLISYVSPAFGGSASDRQVVERSPMLTLCEPGDSIMSDKGFNVQDMFAPRDVTVNIPTFFKKKNRMSGNRVLRDRKISSKRVHIERLIGLAKTFKILKSPMNSTETKLASEIIFVCFTLCNFRKCIFPNHA